MKSFWGLIPKYLAKNKKRNLFVSLSIILSIILIISLDVVFSSAKKAGYKNAQYYSGGDYDIRILSSYYDKKDLNKINKNSSIKNKTITTNFGYYKIPNSKFSIKFGGYDKESPNILNFKLLDGKYPLKENEVALESWIIDKMPQKPKIGDKIKFNIIPNTSGMRKKEPINSEFTLVGTFEYSYGNRNVTRAEAFVLNEYVENTIPKGYIQYTEYIKLNSKESMKNVRNVFDSQKSNKDINIHVNYEKEFLLNAIKFINSLNILLYVIVCIVCIVLIYNTFNVSILQRTKEFGMLRAIGSSPSDIMKLVLGEGLLLGIIFLPIGIILGNLITSFILHFTSDYNNFKNMFNVSTSALVTSTVLVFTSIIIGTYSAAKKASKISPMEAITTSNNFQLKGEKIKNNANTFIHKTLGFTGDMAYLNLKRNKRKFISTVISLSISIVLFMIVNYILNCTNPMTDLKKNIGGDFSISHLRYNSSIDKKNIKSIENIPGLKTIDKSKFLNGSTSIPKEKVTKTGLKYQKNINKNAISGNSSSFNFLTEVYGYSDKSIKNLKPYLDNGNINSNEMSKKPVVLLAKNSSYSDVSNLKVGDKLNLQVTLYDDVGAITGYGYNTFTIVGILEDGSFTPKDGMTPFSVIMTNSVAEKYLKSHEYQKVSVSLAKGFNYETVQKQLKSIFKNSTDIKVTSYKQELENAKKSNLKMFFIMYSFIFIVAMVSIMNIINVMNMNVSLRKNEFGLLRAVGMGRDEVTRIITNEGFFYGLTSSLCGITLGVLATYIFFKTTKGFLTSGMIWHFPFATILIVFIFVTCICFFASITSSRNVTSNSIISSIRTLE